MFGRKKQGRELVYDKDEKMPVIRCSICNGEQVGGLKNRHTGDFEEVMLIKNSDDLESFRKMTGVQDIPKEYICVGRSAGE